jgi:hypothetical protein
VAKGLDARLAGSLLLHFQAGKRVRQGGEVVGRRPRIADARFQDLAHGAVVRLGLLDLISRACGFASLSLSSRLALARCRATSDGAQSYRRASSRCGVPASAAASSSG